MQYSCLPCRPICTVHTDLKRHKSLSYPLMIHRHCSCHGSTRSPVLCLHVSEVSRRFTEHRPIPSRIPCPSAPPPQRLSFRLGGGTRRPPSCAFVAITQDGGLLMAVASRSDPARPCVLADAFRKRTDFYIDNVGRNYPTALGI